MQSTRRPPSLDHSSTPAIGTKITDKDIEQYLTQVEEDQSRNYWNLATAAGLGMIAVGSAYLLQQLGFWEGYGIGLEMLATMLPWLAGILIILVGFGVMSGQSSTADRQQEGEQDVGAPEPSLESTANSSSTDPVNNLSIGQAAKKFVQAVRHTAREKRLIKSDDRKISGVCSGLGEYFGIDPTIVRIAFVIATVFGGGAPVLIYIGLMIAMPAPEDRLGERTTVTVTQE